MTQARNLSRLLNKKLETFKFTATNGQTTFSDSDDAGNILSYTPENMLVTYNGVVLESGSEYTATNGTSVVLDTGADSAAEVNIYAFESVSLGGYLPSTGGTVNSLNVIGGNVGIGTSSPNKSLSNLALTVNAQAGQYGAIELSTGDVGRWYINADATNVYDTTLNNTNRLFFTGGSERMRIDTSGRITMPYQPAFLASNPPNPVTIGTVIFSTTRFNVGGHYSTSTGRFTAPVGGVYFFEAHIRRESSQPTLAWHRPQLSVNGTLVSETLGNLQGHTNGLFSSPAFTIVVFMNSGDYAEVVYAADGSVSTATTANECGFCGYLLG